MKKLISALLVAGILATTLVGCTPNNSSSSASGEEGSKSDTESSSTAQEDPYDKLPKEISAISFERGQCAAGEGSMEDNRWTKWINENSPVKVNWVPIPRAESTQKTNALFASGQAPDLVWEYNKGFMENLMVDGVIQPVDEYIEKYSTVYKEYLEKNPELKPFVSSEDGQMYAFTSKRNITTIPNHAMWIRQDWLDKLGLKTPTTTEDFFEVMTAFRDKDPDGNGKNDTYGAAFNYNYTGITKALFGQPFDGAVITDGKISDWGDTTAFADELAFRERMYDEKFIDPEYVTDTTYAKQRQIWVTGKAGVYFAGWDAPTEWTELRQNVPDSNMVPLEMFETKYGKFGGFQEPPADKIVCMNKDAKNPKAVIEFMDWMLSDGWNTMTFGIEGENYNLVDGIPQAIDVAKNTAELGYANEYPLLKDYQLTTDWFKIQAAKDPLSQEYAVIKGIANETQLKNKFVRNIPYGMSPTEESKNFSAEFGPIALELETKIITDKNFTVEQGVAEIIKTKERLNWTKVLEQKQEWYDKNKANFE